MVGPVVYFLVGAGVGLGISIIIMNLTFDRIIDSISVNVFTGKDYEKRNS